MTVKIANSTVGLDITRNYYQTAYDELNNEIDKIDFEDSVSVAIIFEQKF